MKLLGNRVFLVMPKKEESKLIVDHNTKEELSKEMLKKMNKLTIHSVGSTVIEHKEGDIILFDPSKLPQALVIDLSETEQVLLVSVFDIVGKW